MSFQVHQNTIFGEIISGMQDNQTEKCMHTNGIATAYEKKRTKISFGHNELFRKVLTSNFRGMRAT